MVECFHAFNDCSEVCESALNVFVFSQDSRTALHWACSAGHVNIAQFLLDLGVEVDLQDDVSQHCARNQS